MKKLDKPKRKGLRVRIDPLDTLFSVYIRRKAGWKCERCGNMPDRRGLHCHHFHRRRKQSTRFDPDNGVSLCLGCHQYFGENKDHEEAFMIAKLGEERFDMLQARAMIKCKPDRSAIKLWLKQQLEDLSKSELER